MNIRTHTIRLGGAFDIDRVRNCDGMVVVGSSGAGKSTHVDAARRSPLSEQNVISFPRRLITRAQRLNDDCLENEHVTHEQFAAAWAAGTLCVFWERALTSGFLEYYGFRNPCAGGFPIYSANNAILRSTGWPVEKFLRNKVLVGIHASDASREARLRHRSPDLFHSRPEEAVNRLKDSSGQIVDLVDFVLDTDLGGYGSAGSCIDFVRLVQKAAENPSSLIL